MSSIFNRATKLRWRRYFRRSRRQVEDIGIQAEEHLERHFIRRLSRLFAVRRFVLGWLLLMGVLMALVVVQTRALGNYYQKTVPAPGGIYAEGVVGAFTNANPLYASGSVDSSVSRLIFSGLLKYDEQNRLVGDLAKSWSVDDSEKVYTVVLRDNLRWHDGRRLTANDVVFTYRLIQNPDARSPLIVSWQGVKVEAKDSKTIVFSLPSILSAFPYSLTNGIVPEHILADVEPGQLRSDLFNTAQPVGSGPFKWEAIEVSGGSPETREERIGLVPNPNYHLGMPRLQRLIIRVFRNEDRMLTAFKEHELNAMVSPESLPEELTQDTGITSYSIPVTGEVMAFFSTSHDILKDVRVRQALVRAADTKEVINGLGYPVIAAKGPFLRSHFAYDDKLIQLDTNLKAANRLLDEAGWQQRNQDGIRTKAGQPLSLQIQAKNNDEFRYVAETLSNQWRQVGVDIKVTLPTDSEFQSVVASHNYEILLYGISIGSDPDIFAYWHSSQADPRAQAQLNFSQYSSQTADTALEGGRTRVDEKLRKIKYQPFLQAWRNDAPALALYQPRFLYVVRGQLYNYNSEMVNSASDRFNNIHNWMIRTTKVSK